MHATPFRPARPIRHVLRALLVGAVAVVPAAADPVPERDGRFFFEAIRRLPARASADQVRLSLGRPDQVGRATPVPGERSEVWIYRVRRDAEPNVGGVVRAPTSADAQIFLQQPLGGTLGYERAELFVTGGTEIDVRPLEVAVGRWKKERSPQALLELARTLPLDSGLSVVTRQLGVPRDEQHEVPEVGPRTLSLTYWQEPDAKIALRYELGPGADGAETERFRGAIVHVRPRGPGGVQLLPKASPKTRAD